LWHPAVFAALAGALPYQFLERTFIVRAAHADELLRIARGELRAVVAATPLSALAVSIAHVVKPDMKGAELAAVVA
jgi:hypothetical protein